MLTPLNICHCRHAPTVPISKIHSCKRRNRVGQRAGLTHAVGGGATSGFGDKIEIMYREGREKENNKIE